MYRKSALFVCLVVVLLQHTSCLPIGNPLNNVYNQALVPAGLPEAFPGSPIITEIIPSLQLGDINVAGDLPVAGSIKVKGIFPVYGTVAVDGGLPSAGTAVVNTGSSVATQVV